MCMPILRLVQGMQLLQQSVHGLGERLVVICQLCSQG